VHWTLVAKVSAAVDTSTDIQAPDLSSGTANMNYLVVVGKVVAVAVGALCAVDEEFVGLGSGLKDVLKAVEWTEQWNQFAVEGYHIRCIADMAFEV
jgi:hypothetical protein